MLVCEQAFDRIPFAFHREKPKLSGPDSSWTCTQVAAYTLALHKLSL